MTVGVTVYSRPSCVQCAATYRALDRWDIAHAVVDLHEQPDLSRWVTAELGHTQAPVVVVDQDPTHHWSGHRPDHIASLARGRSSTSIEES